MGNFTAHINWSNLPSVYLLSEVKADNVFSADDILDIISSKGMFGFKLADVMLTLKKRKALKIGDLIDLRDAKGIFFPAMVTGNNGKTINSKYDGYTSHQTTDITRASCIARRGSFTARHTVKRLC